MRTARPSRNLDSRGMHKCRRNASEDCLTDVDLNWAAPTVNTISVFATSGSAPEPNEVQG